MKTFAKVRKTLDPCLQIQMDLSAMLDGELDATSVRRVLVHSDVCVSCRTFLDGIRTQTRAHQDLDEVLHHDTTDTFALDAPVEYRMSAAARALRDQLVKNREQLARIFYELGRGYVLMGVSPSFSRVVAQEPVPIPDVCMRGRSLLDEVERMASGATVGREWVRAKTLLKHGELRTPRENLDKGMLLLQESLMLRPDYHQARIYLGHACHILEDREQARRQFRIVLEESGDPLMRAFALENLGNVDLEEGHREQAIPYFLELVDSGVIAEHPHFFTTYFNLALTYGLLEEFEPCKHWLARLHDEFPHKRRMIRREMCSRGQFAAVVSRNPDFARELEARFACWFPLSNGGNGHA